MVTCMRNLKLLIYPHDNKFEFLDQTLAALKSHYGIANLDIAGVIGEGKFSLQNRELKNISPADVPKTSFDYVIVAGGAFNPAISDYSTLKKTLAEKINAPIESIIFDFELCSGQFIFPNVCLVVMFNHRFDKNLPLLRKIYGEKFSTIRFLMPFYDGYDSDVIPVYESSYRFQGYLIQAYDKLKDIPCSHYLFVGDDLIINPAFDETNFVARTNMYGKKFLDTEIISFNSFNQFRWYWAPDSSKPFFNSSTSWKDSLYTYDEAISKFNDFFGVKYNEIYGKDFFGNPNEPGSNLLGSWNNPEVFLNIVTYFVKTNQNSFHIPYPMARGYSDIFCVDSESLLKFSRLCGIFSAMDMFAEIAIPTAAVLTYKRDEVQFFKGTIQKNTGFFRSYFARILWQKDRDAFENKYDKDFSRLYNDWDEKILYVHPVKLSRWKNI